MKTISLDLDDVVFLMGVCTVVAEQAETLMEIVPPRSAEYEHAFSTARQARALFAKLHGPGADLTATMDRGNNMKVRS